MDGEFGLTDWNHLLRYEVPLRYYAARTLLVTLRNRSYLRKILHLTFPPDGSVFVQCPYFIHSNGILAPLHFEGRGLARTYNFQEGGLVTNHRVKLSHHVDGTVHFSQDGRIRSALRKQSFRLDGPSSHLCQMSAWGIESFQTARPRDVQRRDRPLIMFAHIDALDGFCIVLDWVRREALEELFRATPAPIGPYVEMRQQEPANSSGFVIAAHPRPAPSHFLTVTMRRGQEPTGSDGPAIVLIGGFDNAAMAPHTIPQQSALAWLYPRSATADLLGVPSADFPNGSAAAATR